VIQAVLATLPAKPRFIELVQRLYLERYTGPYIVHALHGNPQSVEFTREQVIVTLDTARKAA
jgi:hypothetical protein